MHAGDADREAPVARRVEPMEADKAWGEMMDRARDEPPYYPGRSWVNECQVAAFAAKTDKDREYYLGEIEMISQGAADETRRILKEGW